MRTLCPEVTREQPPALSDKLNGRLDFLGLPAVQDPWVPSLGWEDPLEKEMAGSLVCELGIKTTSTARVQRLQFLAALNTSCLLRQRKTLDLESTDLDVTIWLVTKLRSLAQPWAHCGAQ